jgi:maltooligosyltrehalose trehalohydrolase
VVPPAAPVLRPYGGVSGRLRTEEARQGFALDRGARLLPDGSVQFTVWAPRQKQPRLRLLAPGGVALEDLALEPQGDGQYGVVTPAAGAGTDYLYLLDDGSARPDPVSRHQPQGVHGPSRVVDPGAFSWSDAGWAGIPLETAIIYELHVGTFTAGGTFQAVIDKLDHLQSLGVNAIELMPVAQFPGERNWGYDGVSLYAPQSSYGGPEGLRRLVDAAHAAGIAVVLDVVYNHLGPEGNYLSQYGPYFTDRYKTPWGEAPNIDGSNSDQVRRFFIDNALHWLTEYHIDGLRVDAVHGIFDFSARHLLEELGDRFRTEAARLGRQAWIIAESDLNDVRVIRPAAQGGWGMDAQWSDDFHHAMHAALAGNRRGYFADFGKLGQVAKALRDGFVYDGVYSPHRRRRHGNALGTEPGERLVVFLQNHDQIANGFLGHRLGSWAGPDIERVAAVVLLSAPNLPMLFMGQEYGETAPFVYFTSHGDPTLCQLVREGRRQEFLSFFEGRPPDEDFPDPQSQESFERSKLGWNLEDPQQAATLEFYRQLIALRRRVPALGCGRRDLTDASADEDRGTLTILRRDGRGSAAAILVNLSDAERQLEIAGGQEGGWRLALATRAMDGAVPTQVSGAQLRVPVPPRTALVYVGGR